jgi:hypothetical protein
MEADDDDGNDDSLRMRSNQSDVSSHDLSTADPVDRSHVPELQVIAPSPTGSEEGSELDSEEGAGDESGNDLVKLPPDWVVQDDGKPLQEIDEETSDATFDPSSQSDKLKTHVDRQPVDVPLLNLITPSPPESVTGTEEGQNSMKVPTSLHPNPAYNKIIGTGSRR